jgi:hypothetical protein
MAKLLLGSWYVTRNSEDVGDGKAFLERLFPISIIFHQIGIWSEIPNVWLSHSHVTISSESPLKVGGYSLKRLCC